LVFDRQLRPHAACIHAPLRGPAYKNDGSVRVGEGDLLLCADCDKERHQAWLASRGMKATTTTAGTAAGKKASKADSKQNQPRSTDTVRPVYKSATLVYAANDVSESINKIVCNDLLSYIHCYRDRSNVDALRRVILSCFSPDDISSAKKLMAHEFSEVFASSSLLPDRRNTTCRLAHEVVVEDIIGIFDILDIK